MGERKVLNKYYPHDFDPSKVPRRRRHMNEQTKVRTMLPMTVRCGACGEYLGRGTKFNARMEDVPGERYLGTIRVFRFYIKCSRCSAEIAFKTDPRNSGYALESGATATRGDLLVDADADAAAAREEEEERRRDGGGDAMAALERRARDGRREMDADAALEEARSLNARRARVAPEQALEALLCRRRRSSSQAKTTQEQEQDADEALVRSIRFRNSAGYVKRIEEDDDREEEEVFTASLPKTMADNQAHKNKEEKKRRQAPVVVVSKRRCVPTVPADGKSHDGGHHADKSEGKASAGDTEANSGALQVQGRIYRGGCRGYSPPTLSEPVEPPPLAPIQV
ncbi:coiled-coil domain-containing protein 94 homolog [Sorghum bicolor]|nr:coiled-coil domain-containing protein 94 homolog [Sorghum bicolor]XP_021311546.1 coiled-coil domain-containing protein 94 homolog [Sorghum bicolor]|eukprot:XP_021311545.1 coiled-coil domain-containing protein 94 homolog [Sorghum bicolor]